MADKKLDDAKQSSGGIDAVAKLERAAKDLGGEERKPKEIKEINVRWEPNGTTPSTE